MLSNDMDIKGSMELMFFNPCSYLVLTLKVRFLLISPGLGGLDTTLALLFLNVALTKF